MSESPFNIGRPLSAKPGRWESILERNLKQVGYSARSKIYGSNAGLCERQVAGLLLLPDDNESNLTAASQFYFSVGSTYETLVKLALEKEGVLIRDEVPIEVPVGNTSVSGRIDFVVRESSSNDTVLVELKSCGKLPAQPKHHHLAQLHTYLLLTGLPRGVLWYISRSVADYTGKISQVVFEIEPTEDELRRAATSIARGAIFAEASAIPPIPDYMRKYKCGFCPLVPYCWDGVDLELKGKEPPLSQFNRLVDESDVLVKDLLDKIDERQMDFLLSLLP